MPLLGALPNAEAACGPCTNTLLAWPSENSLQYLPQRSTNLLVWSNLTTGYLAGTGSNMTWLDPAKGTGNRQFYRPTTT
jgi:hypothetical protein